MASDSEAVVKAERDPPMPMPEMRSFTVTVIKVRTWEVGKEGGLLPQREVLAGLATARASRCIKPHAARVCARSGVPAPVHLVVRRRRRSRTCWMPQGVQRSPRAPWHDQCPEKVVF